MRIRRDHHRQIQRTVPRLRLRGNELECGGAEGDSAVEWSRAEGACAQSERSTRARRPRRRARWLESSLSRTVGGAELCASTSQTREWPRRESNSHALAGKGFESAVSAYSTTRP